MDLPSYKFINISFLHTNNLPVLEAAKVKTNTVVSLRGTFSIFFFDFSVFLGSHPWHIEVPRLGV